MLIKIASSLLKTSVVSLIVSGLLLLVFNLNMLHWFVITFLLQIVFFYAWNSYVDLRLRIEEKEQETKRLEMYESQGVDATCAYCNNDNYIPVRFDQDNEFECEHCGKINSVYVDITVAQKTAILDRQNISVNSYIKEKVDATNKLEE